MAERLLTFKGSHGLWQWELPAATMTGWTWRVPLPFQANTWAMGFLREPRQKKQLSTKWLCFNLQTTQCGRTPIRFLFYLNYLNKVMFLTYLVWGTKILIHRNSIRGKGRREERFMPNVIDHWKRRKVFTWEKERMPKYAWRAGGLRG